VNQGPITLTVKPADSASAAIAAPGVSTITIPKGAAFTTASVMGLQAGTAEFILSDGKSNVQYPVNVDSVTIDHGSVVLGIGQKVLVHVLRMGPVVPYAQVPMITITPAVGITPNIETISPTSFPFSSDVRSFELIVSGFNAGQTSFVFNDAVEGWTFTLQVTVLGTCPAKGTVPLNIMLAMDPFRSADFVNMPLKVNWTFTVANGKIAATATNIPQLPPGSGTIDPNSCGFSFVTTALQQIAGFSNVQVEYDGSFGSPQFNKLTMTIKVGVNNTLNNELQPVTYKAMGLVQ
jgi:hypothetical protein